MSMQEKKFPRLRAKSGFTLIEVVVSTVIIGIAIVAVVGVLRKSREIDVAFLHQRRARAIIDSCFESPLYQYPNYAALPSVSAAPVLIDARDSTTVDDLGGTLNIAVAGPTVVRGVTCKQLTATVSWTEPEGARSISVQRWVTQIQ